MNIFCGVPPDIRGSLLVSKLFCSTFLQDYLQVQNLQDINLDVKCSKIHGGPVVNVLKRTKIDCSEI